MSLVHIYHGWDGVGVGVRVLQHSRPGTGCRSHIAELLLLWPCLCLAGRHIHEQTTVLWWFLDGTGGAVVAPLPFRQRDDEGFST